MEFFFICKCMVPILSHRAWYLHARIIYLNWRKGRGIYDLSQCLTDLQHDTWALPGSNLRIWWRYFGIIFFCFPIKGFQSNFQNSMKWNECSYNWVATGTLTVLYLSGRYFTHRSLRPYDQDIQEFFFLFLHYHLQILDFTKFSVVSSVS